MAEIPLMLCEKAKWGEFPQGWFYEPKFDGARAIAEVRDGQVKITGRSGSDYTFRFPELVQALSRLPDCKLDGEIMCKDWGSTATRTHTDDLFKISLLAKLSPATYHIFDILELDGQLLVSKPLRERKEILKTLPLDGCLSLVLPQSLEVLREKAERGEIEGIVAKNPHSPYLFKRSPYWLKFRPQITVELPVIGWEDSDKKDRPYRSLILLYGGREVQASSGLTQEDLMRTNEIFAKVPHRRVGTKNYFIGGHFTAEVEFFSREDIPFRFPKVVCLKLEWQPKSINTKND